MVMFFSGFERFLIDELFEFLDEFKVPADKKMDRVLKLY